jgi:aminopeptidase N
VNLEKARKHFMQVHDVLRVFEKYFGKYPFWEDSYKLVESPYLGMEHQSAIAYGNLYRRGYLGGNIPSDMDFDYIILHESGHEYFGNALSAIDLADMWLHESFTTYLESLYVEEMIDYESALRYLMNQRAWINNRQPIVGLRGINWIRFSKSTDMYYKGAWILHTMRHMVMDDDKWFDMLRGFYDEYKFQPVISEDFFFYSSEFLDMDLAPFFQQYFYTTEIPEFQYKFRQGADGVHLEFRIEAITPDLEIPMFFEIGSESITAMASNEWRSMWMPVRQDLEIRMPRNKFLMYFTRK